MPSSREHILDVYETIMRTDGERTATLDAVAKGAGVSKGGLIYHFPSKDALAAALCERLQRLGDEDAARMRASADGPAAYYLRSSVYEGSDLDHALIAVARLVQAGNEQAVRTYQALSSQWLTIIGESTSSPVLARIIKLLGDGMYYQALLTTPDSRRQGLTEDEITEIIAVLKSVPEQ